MGHALLWFGRQVIFGGSVDVELATRDRIGLALFPFFKPSLRFDCFLFRTVRIKPDAPPTYPYFDHHALRPPQELQIIRLTSPRIWKRGSTVTSAPRSARLYRGSRRVTIILQRAGNHSSPNSRAPDSQPQMKDRQEAGRSE